MPFRSLDRFFEVIIARLELTASSSSVCTHVINSISLSLPLQTHLFVYIELNLSIR